MLVSNGAVPVGDSRYDARFHKLRDRSLDHGAPPLRHVHADRIKARISRIIPDIFLDLDMKGRLD